MTMPVTEPGAQLLDQRSREIFRAIVENYLREGDPLGSRNLSRILPQSLSPATVRNVMSDLEQLGLIYSPHISAGRLPTQPRSIRWSRCRQTTRLSIRRRFWSRRASSRMPWPPTSRWSGVCKRRTARGPALH